MQREHRQNIPLFVQTEYILITYVWESYESPVNKSNYVSNGNIFEMYSCIFICWTKVCSCFKNEFKTPIGEYKTVVPSMIFLIR